MERQVALHALSSSSALQPRRGVILLVILSLLTLFMMLGATYLVIASRARATARAFAIATNGSRNPINASLGESLVDEALLSVVRGSANSTVTTGSNSLLGDKYGTATAVSGTLVGSATGSLIVAFTASVPGTAVEQLNGRVLTFQTPSLTSASVRILRAEPVAGSSNVKLFIPDGPTLSGVNLSSAAINSSVSGLAGPHFIVNGREFTGGTNEPYDAYDDNNDFLANPLSPSSRPSFSSTTGTTGGNLRIDNDGDGTVDSGWIDVGLPAFADAAGNMIYPRAAILVTDLDGRLNVNAHGSRASVDYGSLYPSTLATGSNALTSVTTSTSSFASGTSFAAYPDGSGFGPAEISLDQTLVFAGSSASPTTASAWSALTEGITASGTASDANSNRPPPNLGPVEGRYGGTPTGTGLPGKPNVNDPVSSAAQAWIATEGSAYFTNPGRYGSPPDVRGRMKVVVDDYGQPVYYKPYWSGTVSSINQDEVTDDPYEVNLFRMSPRTGWPVNAAARTDANSFSYANVADNLFSAADLEAVLRIFDPDSRALPQRLVALSGTQATGNRLLLTTDNWDSSAMTGALRDNISTLITSATASVPLTGTSGTSAYEMFAPETLMGHKFDLNRPFHDTDPTEPNDATGIAERQKFAKHLYSLLYVIAGGTTVSGSTADSLAQWAVNVVDFRDRDSIMTGFEYDRDLNDGWTVDGSLATTSTTSEPDRAVVWGCERPEMLLTETVCWHDRNTEDGGNDKKTTEKKASDQDEDYDQKQRPRGAFFLEIYSPWNSQGAEYDATGLKAVRRTVQGGTSSLLRAEPIPREFSTGGETAATGTNVLGRFDRSATLSLSGTAPSGHPVWRVLSVKRTGTATPTVQPPELAVTGSMWRSFYFTRPPVAFVRTAGNGDVASGSNAIAYWPSISATSTISITPQSPRVFGTGTSFGVANVVAVDTIFKNPTTASDTTSTVRAATLTEPMITLGTDASYDPYAVIGEQKATSTKAFPIDDDIPLDNQTFATSGIGKLIGADGLRTLLQNGRHANYFHLHLQRLADPNAAWNKDTNPYITVDSQPVDLVVENTSPVDSTNYDEPCDTGGTASANLNYDLLNKQRDYDDGDTPSISGTSATIGLERGKTQASVTTDRDIWSARINPAGSNNNEKLLSIDTKTYRAAANAMTAVPCPATTAHTLGSLAVRFTGTTGSTLPNQPFPWMFWANRPFNSAAELAFVPNASPFQLLRLHATGRCTGTDKLSTGWFGHLPRLFEPTIYDSGTTALATPWNVIAGRNATTGSSNSGSSPSLWDAVHVPTAFGGGYATLALGTGTAATTSGSAALQPLGLDDRPFGQLPTFREPGRVNVNTITGSTTWLAVLGSGTQIPTSSGSFTIFNTPATSAKSLMDILQRTVSASGSTFIDSYSQANRNTDTNAFFRYQTVNRVANNVTVRSNVFAVWITIGFFDNPDPYASNAREYGYDTGFIQRYRGFYIYDRSLPVGFSPGKDYNVRDAIMLRRIIP